MDSDGVVVVHDGCGETPGGAARVSVELANVFEADLYVGRTGCADWYREHTEGSVTVVAPWANRLPTALRDMAVAYRIGKLHLPDYGTVVTSGVPAKFYQPESFQRHVHYTHHPPLRYGAWLGREDLSGVGGNGRYLLRKAAMYADWLEMQRVDTVLANSETTRRRIGRHYRREATVVNPPVDHGDLTVRGREERGDWFLYAGRLGERKRMETLVRAFGRTGEKLVVLGDGPLRSELESLALECEADVEFRGFVPEQAVREAMATAKCGVFIPIEEDFGMAIAECLCLGTPVIVSDEPNPKYMVDGENGMRVDPTVEAIADALRAFEIAEFDPTAIATAARERYGAARFESEVRESIPRERTI